MAKLVIAMMLVAIGATFNIQSFKRELMSVLMPGWGRDLALKLSTTPKTKHSPFDFRPLPQPQSAVPPLPTSAVSHIYIFMFNF